MKIEVINENRVQITLSIEELSQRDVSLKDIEKDSKKARKLFLELIEETNLQQDFSLEHSQVFVEACTDSNNEFIVTITKIENFPDISKFDILNVPNAPHKSSYQEYYSHFNIYEFSDLDTLIELSKCAKQFKCYLGKNSLYKYNNKYFLVFSYYSLKNTKFTKTASLLNEYCDYMYEKSIAEISLKEKAKLLIENKALQTFAKAN